MSLLKIKEILDVKKYNKPIIIAVVVFAITTIIIFVYNKSEKEEKFTNNQNPTILPGKDIENTSSELQDTNKTILVNEIPQHEHNIKNTFIKEYDFMYIINPEYDDNNTNNNTNSQRTMIVVFKQQVQPGLSLMVCPNCRIRLFLFVPFIARVL